MIFVIQKVFVNLFGFTLWLYNCPGEKMKVVFLVRYKLLWITASKIFSLFFSILFDIFCIKYSYFALSLRFVKKNIFIFCSCFLFSQIEGAFIQGLGWAALEELKWGDGAHKWVPPGHLYTNGPGAYKIPSVNDVPLKFNVSLLKVCSWTLNIFFSSFLMGE